MDTERVAGDRASAAVALLATAWVAVITVLDLVLPTSVVPDTLLALAPLIACSVLRPRVTAGFGLAAILLVVRSGGWNPAGTPRSSGSGCSMSLRSARPPYWSQSCGCTAKSI